MRETSESENRGQGYRWHAAIARDLARHCQSEGARAALQDMARRYERLAAWAESDPVPHTPARPGPVAIRAQKAGGTRHVQ